MFKEDKDSKDYITISKKNLERLAFVIAILALVFIFLWLPKICKEKYSSSAMPIQESASEVKEEPVMVEAKIAEAVEKQKQEYKAMLEESLKEQRVEMGKKHLEEIATLKKEFQNEIDYLKQQLEEKEDELQGYTSLSIGEVTIEDKGNDIGLVKSIVVEINNQKAAFKPKVTVFVYDDNDTSAEQNLADANIFLVDMPVGKAVKTMAVDISVNDLDLEKTIKVKLYDADTDELLATAEKAVIFI